MIDYIIEINFYLQKIINYSYMMKELEKVDVLIEILPIKYLDQIIEISDRNKIKILW